MFHHHWKEDIQSFQMIPYLEKLREPFSESSPKLGHS